MSEIDAASSARIFGRGGQRRDGRLAIVLADAEPPPRPVHLITPEGRLSVPKVRAFVDFAAPRLKAAFARLSCNPAGPRRI